MAEELSRFAATDPGRTLLRRITEMLSQIGGGEHRRPDSLTNVRDPSDWVQDAAEAMNWVSEERGLGGSLSLDGIAWDMSVDRVWESWVVSFSQRLALSLGMHASGFGGVRRELRWRGPVKSMRSLVPDVELRSPTRIVLIDAKYKAHFEQLVRKGWGGLSDHMRSEHRADIHQALAYASLTDVPRVDSVLVYPEIAGDSRRLGTVATVTAGRRQVRLLLATIPFGFSSPEHRESTLREFRTLLLNESSNSVGVEYG